MAKKRQPKGPETLYDKVKKFDEDFAVGIYQMSDEAMKAKLTDLAGENDRIEQAKESDMDIKRLQNELTTAKQTYTVPLKQNRLREKLMVQTLRERGKLA